MTFNSYKPFKKRNLLPRYIVIFLLGISFTLFFSSALNIVTDIKNATQYIKEIILTNDGSAKGTTGIIIDGSTSGGRIGSELYCNIDFSECINVKGLVQTGDLTGFIKTGDLESELNGFKGAYIDPPILELSGSIIGLLGRATSLEGLMNTATGNIDNLIGRATSLEGLMNTATGNIDNLISKSSNLESSIQSITGSLETLQTKNSNLESSMSNLTGDTERIDTDTDLLFDTINQLINNLKDASTIADLKTGLGDNIIREEE